MLLKSVFFFIYGFEWVQRTKRLDEISGLSFWTIEVSKNVFFSQIFLQLSRMCLQNLSYQFEIFKKLEQF